MAVPVEGDTMNSECEAVALLSCHLFYKKPQLVVWLSRSSLERPHGSTASQNILSQVEGDQFVSRLLLILSVIDKFKSRAAEGSNIR